MARSCLGDGSRVAAEGREVSQSGPIGHDVRNRSCRLSVVAKPPWNRTLEQREPSPSPRVFAFVIHPLPRTTPRAHVAAMPKKEKKRARKGAAALPQTPAVAVEDDETASNVSDVTDSTIHQSDEEAGIGEEEIYETKLKEAMDLATEKSVQTRTNALISLKIALQKRIMTSFLVENFHTMADLVERSLKKGRGMEQVAAAKLASVLVLSLIDTEESEEVYKILKPVLCVLVEDPTGPPQARQEAASSLALLAFFACPEPSDLPAALNVLHNVFCAALPKGNGELPNHSPAVVALHAAALQAVCVLLTLLPHSTVYTMAPKMLEELTPVLMTSDLDLRITVGEAMALVYESAREHADDFRWKKHGALLDKLFDLVNESHKYKAKKDKKVQRASFREVIRTVKDGESSFGEVVVSVGPTHHQQELSLSSWALRFQYHALCHALELGLNAHMTRNAPLRELFDLGPPPNPSLLKTLTAGGSRAPKRPNRQTPQAKARILARGKNRDNRAAALAAAYDD